MYIFTAKANRYTHDFWTSGICPEPADPSNKSNWVWDLPSGHEPITYDNWALRKPNALGRLLYLSGGHKFDQVPSYDMYEMRFICEVNL